MRRRQHGGLIAAQLRDVPWQPPRATYLAWLDCRRIGDGEQPRNVFLDHGRVALEPGPRFLAAQKRPFERQLRQSNRRSSCRPYRPGRRTVFKSPPAASMGRNDISGNSLVGVGQDCNLCSAAFGSVIRFCRDESGRVGMNRALDRLYWLVVVVLCVRVTCTLAENDVAGAPLQGSGESRVENRPGYRTARTRIQPL